MKTDLMTKGLLGFVGSGMWALAATHWQVPVVTAQAPEPAPAAQDVVRTGSKSWTPMARSGPRWDQNPMAMA
jgi:hypothetical protein